MCEVVGGEKKAWMQCQVVRHAHRSVLQATKAGRRPGNESIAKENNGAY